jgi:transcriptional regulator with XRE-family HTH domain
MSQSELARKSRLGQNTISTAARGRDTNTRTLTMIANALGVPLAEVLVLPGRQPPALTELDALAARVLALEQRFRPIS